MRSKKREDFYSSERHLGKFKDKIGIIGYMNWEIFDGERLIQCWNTNKNILIIQIYPNGCGFQDYHSLSKKQEQADTMFDTLKVVKMEFEELNCNDKLKDSSNKVLNLVKRIIKKITN